MTACTWGPWGTHQEPDAAVDAGPYKPPVCMPPSPLCINGSSSICGNGKIDYCWYQPMPGHCYYLPGPPTEACDGTSSRTCESLGYLGGTTSCTSSCTIDTSHCTTCGPGATSCVRGTSQLIHGAALSGSFVAVTSLASVAIYTTAPALASVTSTNLDNVNGIVAVPNGWLVATSAPDLRFLATDGTLGAVHALPAGATTPVLASNANGDVIVAWNELVGSTTHVFAALADETGTTTVGARDLFASDGAVVAATSDGTGFFVGADGTLAHVTTAATFTVTTGFPTALGQVGYAINDLSWDGTTGWYVHGDQITTSYIAQRFDANGALVGPTRSFTVFRAVEFLDDGDDLLAVVWPNSGVRVHRYRPDGTVVMGELIGASFGQPTAALFHDGAQLLLTWNDSVALAPEP